MQATVNYSDRVRLTATSALDAPITKPHCAQCGMSFNLRSTADGGWICKRCEGPRSIAGATRYPPKRRKPKKKPRSAIASKSDCLTRCAKVPTMTMRAANCEFPRTFTTPRSHHLPTPNGNGAGCSLTQTRASGCILLTQVSPRSKSRKRTSSLIAFGISSARRCKMKHPDLKDVLTTKEAAQMLDTSVTQVRRLAKGKSIAAIKLSRCWVVYKPSLAWYRERAMHPYSPEVKRT